MNDPAFQSASDVLRSIRGKRISSIELLESYIERTGHLNPRINGGMEPDSKRLRCQIA